MIGLAPLLVVALAAYRITRALTLDTITDAARERVYRWAWDDEHPIEHEGEFRPASRGSLRSYVYELVTCSWCMGFWVSVATYSAWRWSDSSVVRAVIAIFAVAGVQGFIASRHNA